MANEPVKSAARPRPQRVDVARAWVGAPRALGSPGSGAPVDQFGVRYDDTAAFRRRAASECLDTLGMLRSYREPIANESWRIPAPSERRLLAQVDAILMLGPPALAHAEQLAIDPDVPDPDRVFAALFAMGCTAGEAYVGRCPPLFHSALLRDRSEAAAAVEALCLCSSTALPETLTPSLVHDTPAIRAAAVRVLCYRGELSTEHWCRALADADPRVVLAALSGSLHTLDRGRADAAMQPLYTGDREMLVRAALRAGWALGLPSAQSAARAIAAHSPAWADALYLLALGGSPDDKALLERGVATDLPAAARACAHAGWLPLGSRLVAAHAVHSQVNALGPAIQQALTTMVALPEGTGTDPNALATAWVAATNPLDDSLRYRQGRPWGPHELMQQLRTGPHLRPQRQELYFELQILTQGRVPRFNAFDFIGAQHDALDRIAACLAGKPEPAQQAH